VLRSLLIAPLRLLYPHNLPSTTVKLKIPPISVYV